MFPAGAHGNRDPTRAPGARPAACPRLSSRFCRAGGSRMPAAQTEAGLGRTELVLPDSAAAEPSLFSEATQAICTRSFEGRHSTPEAVLLLENPFPVLSPEAPETCLVR